MKQWNEVFKKEGKFFIEPQEDMAKIVNIFKKKGVKRVLDLGCGSGRHIVYLAKNGFDAYGIDIAEEGIKIARNWLKDEKLRANLKVGSMYKNLPYKDNFFDAIISIWALHHERLNNVRKAIKESERILKPNGLVFITLFKRNLKSSPPNKIIKKRKYQKADYMVIEPSTYIPLEGHEKGLPHFLFNKFIIKKEFHNFKIKDIWVGTSKRHYCFVGKLKK